MNSFAFRPEEDANLLRKAIAYIDAIRNSLTQFQTARLSIDHDVPRTIEAFQGLEAAVTEALNLDCLRLGAIACEYTDCSKPGTWRAEFRKANHSLLDAAQRSDRVEDHLPSLSKVLLFKTDFVDWLALVPNAAPRELFENTASNGPPNQAIMSGKINEVSKKGRGHPITSDYKLDEKISNEWEAEKQAGHNREDFVEQLKTRSGNKIKSVRDLNKLLDRVRKRRKNSN
ncbi:hypothetical protein [Zavarzinella formosa]|uniref:hypothetical protein n=1 Tax=Zavarzinella formosa TaxID=360055 RepID=UPI000496EB6B|nr:hypothetical protein [Zavarzinella formosa]